MKNLYLLLIGSLCGYGALAQTNPTAQTLPFNFTTLTDSTLPAGISMHKFAAIITTRTKTAATLNLPYIAASASGGWNNQTSNGIGILASGTNPAGALIVAINTTGKANITTSWKASTILNQASRDNSIALQYRVGTSGDFTDIGTASTYSSGTAGTNQAFSELLPAAAENQAVVQLRWLYWESAGTSGSRDRLALTNISVTTPAVACTTPAAQPGSLVFSGNTDVAVTGSFIAPAVAANEYLVVCSSNNSLSSAPVDGQIYNAGDGLGDGIVVGRSNAVSFTATGLSAATTYYFFVFSVNSACTNGPAYLSTTPLTGNTSTTAGLPQCTAPTAQPTTLNFTNTTVNSTHGSFTATAADEYLVIKSTSATLTTNPVNGTAYNPGDAVGNGTVIQRNNSLGFSATGLQPNTSYYYFIFSLNNQNCINGPAYNSSNCLTGSQTSLALQNCNKPVSQSTNIALTPSNKAISGNFIAAANTDAYLVVQSLNATLSAQPIDNTDYAIGDNIGGATVVANGSGTSFGLTNLLASTTYYVFIYSANKNCSGGTKYFTTNPLIGNTTTTSTPVNNVYFGTLHAHSDFSDGNKDNPGYSPADDFTYAQSASCLDYLGISEHNHFSSTNNPGNTINNYHQGSIQAKNYSIAHPNFVALYGMEWGVISGGGHVVVYGDGMDQLFGWENNVGGITGNNYDVFVAKNDYTGTSGLFKTVNDNIGTNTFATLAHPNSTDFGNIAATYTAVADNAIVGSAVESGPAFSTNTNYTDGASSMSYLSYFQKLLARGYHVGPTIDHDNHNTTFGHTTTSRTAIVAPALTKSALVTAMRNRHFYATQDCDSKVDFTINTQIMGSVITDKNAPVIALYLTDATTATNNAVIKIMYGIPGSGTTAESIYSVTGNSLNFIDNNLANMASGYYYADITNGTSRIITSPIWYTRNDNKTLPVTLTAFNLQKINSGVKVAWETAQELNSNYFMVQHSTEGKIWQDLAKIPAAGFSAVPVKYQSVDNAPNVGINYYRLKQVDIDGKTAYSTIQSVVFAAGKEILITPNPATDYLNVYLLANSKQSVISLFNINGNLIKTYTTNNASYQINTTGIAKGIYLLKVFSGNNITTQKIIIQ